MKIQTNHYLSQVKHSPSPYFNLRPNNEISLVVIHCISLPEGDFGQPYIHDLFCGQLDCSQDDSFSDLQGLEVSAHLLIKRSGEVEQFVAFDQRAWHAGVSSFENRDNCNDFSIGIELEGTDISPFTSQQYHALIEVTRLLLHTYPQLNVGRIVGHSDIAPGRKTDPGIGFDWQRFRQGLK